MPIFVSLLDSEMLKLGNDLFFPSTMKEQPYERLIQRIKLHLAPRKKVIPQRCRFLKRIQLENESISEYLRELRHLAMDCTFGEMLEVMLRDRFVAGIKSENLQKKLLQEDDDVTLDRARSLPFSLKKKVENEIDGMVNEGILQPIEYANWAAPIVPVLKKDGSLRICGDSRCTANKAIELDKYPLPSIDEIFSKLSGNTVFSSLDLSRAYLQVRLSEEAKRVVNINTTKGLFAFKRLPYGVAVAPNKFQREMDNLFADMSGVACYIDNILVAGKDHRDHEQKLELVFKRLQEKGLLMYYSRFIRNIADILAPFYHLLKKNSKWNWTSEHRILFAKCKALLTNESVLAHYDATRELVLACDASSYGLGVVLSHRNDRKEEPPIAFASRTLTEAERRYSQLEKEALSIIFGCEKFRQYLLGREFVLITDNRPLMHIFSSQKPIPICAASRIKRWSLKLSAFKYTVEFRKTDDNGNADALSRLPLVSKTTESLDEDQVLLLRKMSEVPFSFQDVAVETRRDKLLSIVLRNVRENNWQIPKVSQENPLYSYYRIKDELSCEFGCLQWRERVVIPQKLRSLILNDLHEMHLGMVKMKMIARRYFWWPGIDKNIEELARDCRICQESASMPPSTISEWTWPEKPWHRLHLDLAGPFMGRMFMVLVDAYTKWLEIVIIKDITSRTIIGHLREIFARFGLPELLVTDNGRQFVSSEFEEFTKINGIRHTKTSPYNPSTNGLAERYVREFKNSLRKNQGKDSIEINLQRFLFAHRAFPQTVLKESPAEPFMKRSLRSRFSNLILKMAKVGEVYHDAMRKQEHFAVGSDVYFRSFANGPKWKKGRVMELLSSRHYLIEDEGRYVKRHINQLRPVIKKEVPEVRDLVLPGTSRDFILPGTSRDHPRLGGQEKTMEEAPEVDKELKGAESSAQEDTPEPEPCPAAAAVPVPVRSPRPQRSRRPPDRLHYY
ncbi:K02A2.6-like [Cordylochernes scorpioides]|uniref:RNA-directed DNA polymerase n=1 Tax=Cordylochernes scorpioides TaxID=51811 RepID=A0ABY6KQ55_9ARAC|nr:K02A2.6-like [Cordylochernes scorpioides]